MKFGFIGAGKVGFSLGRYFKDNSIQLSGYYSRNKESAIEAAKFTKSNFYNNLNQLIEDSNIIFITTPDNEIGEVWNQIKEYDIKEKIICHCSGSLSSKVFSKIHEYKAYGYSIHPMFAISDKYNSHKDLNKAYFTIEGDSKYLDYFSDLFSKLNNNFKIISDENKAKYHAASVIISNHVIALAKTSNDLLVQCGFSEEEANEALFPLMYNNVLSIGTKGTTNSLTGPVERGDTKTIKKHLECLNNKDKELYKLLSEKLIKIAEKKNKDRNYSDLYEVMGD